MHSGKKVFNWRKIWSSQEGLAQRQKNISEKNPKSCIRFKSLAVQCWRWCSYQSATISSVASVTIFPSLKPENTPLACISRSLEVFSKGSWRLCVLQCWGRSRTTPGCFCPCIPVLSCFGSRQRYSNILKLWRKCCLEFVCTDKGGQKQSDVFFFGP